ncbi:MAG TPA: hypothetical protein VJM08_06740 [Anaerolineales bacterium]|nr:hypothetical protein [Anaerolineales bacterium]
MNRIPWAVLLALLAGIGLGLAYAWVISPLQVIDAEPVALRADFKDQYRSAIAAAYAATGDLPRAQARLSLLKDNDPIEALNAQAQRMLANGVSFEKADQVAALASALDEDGFSVPAATVPSVQTQTPTIEIVNNTVEPPTSTIPPPTSELPIQSTEITETSESIETQVITAAAATPRPTRTSIPTFVAPFALTEQESVCDSNLSDGLLQVLVFNSNRRQVAGVEILITWDGGAENFFTGLKPELGNGYADYIMTPNVTYTVQLRLGSDIASGLTTPTCQTPDGATFFGGVKLTFQQP